MRRLLPLVVVFLVAVPTVAAASTAASGAWEPVNDAHGILVERRHARGSRVYEVRATTTTALSPEAVVATLWRQREYPEFVPYLEQLEVLRESPRERVLYQRVKVPLVAERDFTVRVRRVDDPAAHTYRLEAVATPELGPPPRRGAVRVTLIHASWTVEPFGEGARVTYRVLTDPAGSLPRFIVNMAQKDAVPSLVRAMLDRAAENLQAPSESARR